MPCLTCADASRCDRLGLCQDFAQQQLDMQLIRYTRANAGAPGHNEYGCPLHACWGYRHDAHYWAWVASWCGDGSGVQPAAPALVMVFAAEETL